MKDVSFSWNEMLFAMQKTDFHVLELFCRASHVRASMHRITSLELLSTLMLCLVQLSKWERMQGQGCWKASFSVREVAKSFFAEQVMLELQCTESLFRASKNTNAVFSATKQMKECKATDAEKLLLSERKLLNAILRVSSSTWKMFLSHEMKCYLQCRRQIFMLELF